MPRKLKYGYDWERGEWGSIMIEVSEDCEKLHRIVEQVDATGTRIGEIFGTASPEYAKLRELQTMLRHDLDIMERQDCAAPTVGGLCEATAPP